MLEAQHCLSCAGPAHVCSRWNLAGCAASGLRPRCSAEQTRGRCQDRHSSVSVFEYEGHCKTLWESSGHHQRTLKSLQGLPAQAEGD